eukprot:SM000008S22173  [mRNA]  locus=s8:194538:202369:+ [translate_table: standard]
MKCNGCWKPLDGRAIATTCGHIFCTDDASRILQAGTCPLCEHALSKSNMKAVDMSPSDDWINVLLVAPTMIMAGIPPHSSILTSACDYLQPSMIEVSLGGLIAIPRRSIPTTLRCGWPEKCCHVSLDLDAVMKSAFKGVVFWIGQKDVESQVTVTKAVQLKARFEEVQAKYLEKLEQVHAAYQKAMKRAQALEHEKESLVKDRTELQEKQKRKLEEMYDSLKSEYDLLKRGTIMPSSGRRERTSLFDARPLSAGNMNMPRDRTPVFDAPSLPPRARTGGSPAGLSPSIHYRASPFPTADTSVFTPTTTNPSNALRNLLLSPLRKWPRQSSKLSRPPPALRAHRGGAADGRLLTWWDKVYPHYGRHSRASAFGSSTEQKDADATAAVGADAGQGDEGLEAAAGAGTVAVIQPEHLPWWRRLGKRERLARSSGTMQRLR